MGCLPSWTWSYVSFPQTAALQAVLQRRSVSQGLPFSSNCEEDCFSSGPHRWQISQPSCPTLGSSPWSAALAWGCSNGSSVLSVASFRSHPLLHNEILPDCIMGNRSMWCHGLQVRACSTIGLSTGWRGNSVSRPEKLLLSFCTELDVSRAFSFLSVVVKQIFYFFKYAITETQQVLIIGLIFASGNSISEPAASSSVQHRDILWTLLTKAIPSASLWKPCHINPIQTLTENSFNKLILNDFMFYSVLFFLYSNWTLKEKLKKVIPSLGQITQ